MGLFKKIGEKFFSSKFPMVGVDISDSSIEFIQLQSGLGKTKIKSNYRLELAPGLVTNGRIADLSQMAMILKAAFKKGDFHSDYCLLSLPDKETYFLNLKGENLQTEVYSLAQENLPVDLGQCYYDFLQINETEVFFVAAPKDIIKQYQEVFRLAELNLEVIDFESACLARALTDFKELNQPKFIIDLGAKSTDIILIDNKGFRDQVNFAVGGQVLSEKIAEKMKIDFAEADKIKIDQGLIDDKYELSQEFELMMLPVFAEIKKIADEYEQQHKKIVNTIVLSGGTSKLKGINEIFVKNLPGFQYAKGDLDKKIDFDDLDLAAEKILYSNVIGLALRGLNSTSLDKGINLIKNLNN